MFHHVFLSYPELFSSLSFTDLLPGNDKTCPVNIRDAIFLKEVGNDEKRKSRTKSAVRDALSYLRNKSK